MRRGTTTMNMISSTSTTSTSGVMLMSDCRSEPRAPWLSCMTSISFCAGALGDQPDPAEAGLLDYEHRLPDLAKVKFCVASDHDLRIRHCAHRGDEGFGEMAGCDRLIVDPQPAGVVDGDQNPASLVALCGRLRRVRQIDIRALPHLRRHHHEYDQQHQHHVDERRDVNGRLHLCRLTEPHTQAPPS